MKFGSVGNLINPAPGADPLLGRIDRAAELGLNVISIGFREPAQRDPGYMASVAERAAKKGVELRLGGGGRFGSADPAERQAEVDRVIESLLFVNKHTGIKFSSLANGPMSHNRWSPEPPMDERIEIIGDNLAKVADGVASAGMTIGLENHCDYRGYECAAMLARGNRPNLRCQLDTGNAFTVFEEPVDCARALAKYTVSVHLKDVKVTPYAHEPFMGTTGASVALGEGNVDNAAICGILAAESPNPAGLALMIEPLVGLFADDAAREKFLQTSIAWARANLAAYIS